MTRRRLLGTAAAAGVAAAAARWGAGTVPAALTAPALRRGGTLKIAETGEPPTLDNVITMAVTTAQITLPVYEQLFAFDAGSRAQPQLVSGYTVSKDGLTYTFTLRKNVPFHNGKTMGADDVVASLNRWGKVSSLGPSVYQHVDAVSAPSSDTVIMKMKTPFAPLLAYLAWTNGAAAIMPKEVCDAAGTQPLRQITGTGPYKLAEWAPDRYVHLARFDQYAARTEPASGYAGRKEALADDIYYYPVSQTMTRIAGVQSGTYDIADGVEHDSYQTLADDPRVEVGRIPGTSIFFFLNQKQGMMTNPKMRQAIATLLDMKPIMQATFGSPNLYSLDPSIFPKGTPWYTEAGASQYNLHDPDKAKALAKAAGYSGQPIRWLTTQEYEWDFKTSVVASAQMEQAGFKVDLQVMDWASVLDHRSRPADWDMFVTQASFTPDPALITVYNSTYPGWWDTPTKDALFAQFNDEPDQAKRVQLWAKLQALLYAEVPVVRPGAFARLLLSRKGLVGFQPSLFLITWNVQAMR